ncbi:MAG: hypothetical protein ACXWT0_01820 [Methylobacter sp.]
MKLSSIDVVAANMRNAFFDAADDFVFTDRYTDQLDAQVLESCYKKLDVMPDEEIGLYAQCISMGFELKYDPSTEEFFAA